MNQDKKRKLAQQAAWDGMLTVIPELAAKQMSLINAYVKEGWSRVDAIQFVAALCMSSERGDE